MEKENKKIKMSFPKSVVGNLPLSMLLLKEDKQPCFNGKVEDPRQRHSGMTISMYNGNNAFTLIELLVVVLIIGILAAVAVPQYEKVVERSKATQALTLLKSVGMAAEEHMLASGNEISSFDELSVDIPWPVSARVQGISQDTHSNGEWAIEIEHYTVNGGGSILWMTRLKGKYKGACFIIPLGQGSTHNSDLQIKCVERKTGGTHLFSTSLAQGSYCEKIMKGTLNGEDAYSRLYNLP